MISRNSLHQLVDDLPETEIVRAERLLAVLAETAEPPRFTLENAPEDDEGETPGEAAAVAEAWRDHREGKSLTTEELAGKPTILELRGLGKELWKDIDPMEHVRAERDSWARRVPGLHPDSMEAAADFDAPLPDELWLGNE